MSSLGGGVGRERGKPRVGFREGGERLLVEAERGATLLEVSLGAGLPHYHACGGRAKCTTCRVVVLEGSQNAGPRTEAEAAVATARRWPSTIRLACQMKVLGDVTVRRLVVDAGDASAVNALQSTQEPLAETAAVAQVTLHGFERFAREQFAHDAVHVFNRYLRELVEPALANGGRVLRYLSGGALLAFPAGADGSLEAPARHALRASLRVLARVRQLNPYTLKHFGREFDLSIGLDAGALLHAEVGHPSHRERLSFGEAVVGAGLASQLALEEGASVVATESFARALEGALRLGRVFEGLEQRRFSELLDFSKPDVVFLVQSTFEQLAGRADDFAHAFYDRLFELHPPYAALFAETDMTTQRTMLMDMIAKAVQGLDQPEVLLPVLRDLGRRHVTYGVQAGHYKHVGRVLIDTLERYLGEAFTPEVHVAWMEIYGLLARTMIEAGGPDGDAAARTG